MNRTHSITRLVLAGAVLLVAGAACGGESKVGNDKTLAFKEKEGNRLGGIETTTTAHPTTTVAPTTAPPTTTKRATSTTAAPPSQAVTISITNQRYDPFNFSVKKGTTIRVVNNDSQPRTFTSDTGAFDSGMLQPGASWSYVTSALGKFNFHDETRPYVVGQMEVTG